MLGRHHIAYVSHQVDGANLGVAAWNNEIISRISHRWYCRRRCAACSTAQPLRFLRGRSPPSTPERTDCTVRVSPLWTESSRRCAAMVSRAQNCLPAISRQVARFRIHQDPPSDQSVLLATRGRLFQSDVLIDLAPTLASRCYGVDVVPADTLGMARQPLQPRMGNVRVCHSS